MKKIREIIQRVSYILDSRERRKLLPLVVLTLIGSAFELIGVTVFMPLIQIIMQPDSVIKSNKYLYWAYSKFHFTNTTYFMVAICVAIILIYVIKNVFLIWQKKVIYQYSFDVQKHLATKLLNAYMHEPYSFFLQKNIAELQRALQEDVANFSGFIMQFLELAAELVVCILIIVYLFTVNMTICVVVAGTMALCVFAFVMVSKRMSTTLGRDCQRYKAKIYQWINQAIGGIKEVVVNGETGYLVDPDLSDVFPHDPKDGDDFAARLAEKINVLIRDPALAKKMGQAGRLRVEKHFSWQSIALQTKELYTKLVEATKK